MRTDSDYGTSAHVRHTPFPQVGLAGSIGTAQAPADCLEYRSPQGLGLEPTPPSYRAGPVSRALPDRDCTPIVFVVDDDVSVRESLDGLIRFSGWRAEAFGSAREFLEHPRASVPSCLVLDMRLPDSSGLELQRRIAMDRADMPIIFLTGYSDVPITVRAMKAGAIEFFMKPFDDDELLTAIGRALETSRTKLEQEADQLALRARHQSLSSREQEVMALVVTGLLNKQVGFELGISEITVKAHRGKVMRKMEANSLADLVAMAARLGLPSPLRSNRLRA